MKPKAIMAWSSGKDSAFALAEVLKAGEVEVVSSLTTLSDEERRISMHQVRETLLDRQIEALGLPAIKCVLPNPCPNDTYEREMGRAMDEAKARGVTHVIFGDLFLADIRAYRESMLDRVGLRALFPLWERNTHDLARAMIASGLSAVLTTVDTKRVDPSFAGRRFDASLLSELPPDVDPCGENGEFHSFVTHSPAFSRPIDVTVGDTRIEGQFAYADVLLSSSGRSHAAVGGPS